MVLFLVQCCINHIVLYFAAQNGRIKKKGIPFSIELPAEIKTLDTMTENEFDEMMQTGLTQAKNGDSVPYEEAFDQLWKNGTGITFGCGTAAAECRD